MSEIEWERGDLGSQAHVGGYELRVDMDALGWTANVYETANAVSVSVATREEAEAAAVEGLRRHLQEALEALPAVAKGDLAPFNGRAVRAARRAKDIHLGDFAALLGVSSSTLSEFERGLTDRLPKDAEERFGVWRKRGGS